jgi:glycosyltransferase involved in cell wall biosynthesis
VDVSVLVPAKDEAENLPRFLELADLAFAADPRVRYEVVVVDDGSVDGTWPLLAQLQERYPWLRAARHRARRGIADALRTGYLNARGDVLVFYPADLQFMPEDIPRLAAPILAGESDMVTGYKQGSLREGVRLAHLQPAESRAVRRPRARPQQRQGVPREIMAGLPVRPTGTAT